ncbi:MAG TPA: Isoquinoline 1-oxidoreductase subunit [Xanthobacteraceae bacterium]|jgi:hypothetical protein|nr:Isoquinoline 1-oxidoreductase subunit [Xanthobacteraceae bacterium]
MPIMRPTLFICALLAATSLPGGVAQPQTANELRSPAAFANISDPAERSRALFAEAAKVLTSPRCMNCHPAGDHPLQGADHHPHQPPVQRGPEGAGVPGTPCSACHTSQNVDLLPGEVASYRSIPGHPRWQLAPREMAWEGKTIGEICRQIKDRSRNGGRDLAQIREHVAKDDLVAYGWHPGTGRAPAPGTQEQAGELIQAWIDTGAECP